MTYYYAKIQANTENNDMQKLFVQNGATIDSIFIDSSVAPKRPNSLYQCIKKKLIENNDNLVIDSITSLGKNNREISKELKWFKDNGINLIILDIPSTKHLLSSPLDTLSEVYSNFANVEIKNVKTEQQKGIQKSKNANKPLGRKKIPYPEGWDDNYCLWKQGKITSSEFLKLSGLKKGTFYNLIKQYKEEHDISIDISKQGA